MIDDDATPEELDAWYRRTPDQIAAEKAARWNAAWSALRMPDDQAYQPDDDPSAAYGAQPAGQQYDADTPSRYGAAQPADEAATGDAVDAAAKAGGSTKPPPLAKTAWANHELGWLDVLAKGESNQDDGGYDVLYTPSGPPRRLPAGPSGAPDYSHFPAALAYQPKHGKSSSAAGRYGLTEPAWRETVAAHPDVTDWTPLNQNKAAWYYGASVYRRKTGRDLSADLRDESRWPGITAALNKTWSSLPGGDSQRMTQEEFNQRLRAATARYRDLHPDD